MVPTLTAASKLEKARDRIIIAFPESRRMDKNKTQIALFCSQQYALELALGRFVYPYWRFECGFVCAAKNASCRCLFDLQSEGRKKERKQGKGPREVVIGREMKHFCHDNIMHSLGYFRLILFT